MAEELDKNIEAAAETAAEPAVKQGRSKSGRYIPSGIAFVLASFNNTKVTITDQHKTLP